MREPPFFGVTLRNSENGFKKDSIPKNYFGIEVWRDEGTPFLGVLLRTPRMDSKKIPFRKTTSV
jgi:hypothetical protein